MARLGRLVGRGRAAEILFGGDDIPAALAQRYGYVNRVLPDAGLAGFVDAFARRVAGFDKEAVAGIRPSWTSQPSHRTRNSAPVSPHSFRTSGRPEDADRGTYLFDHGLHTPTGAEQDLGRTIGDIAAALDL